MYEYDTDGLIFTPLEYGVGCMKPGEASKNKKNIKIHCRS